MKTTNVIYVPGDATSPITKYEPNIIAHICNDIGGWGKGFVLAISRRWSEPRRAYRTWFCDGASRQFALGMVQFVRVEPDILVANMIAQSGIRPVNDVPPIRYTALEETLSKVAQEAIKLGASVHMPRIGCGLAGGQWEHVVEIIDRTLSKVGVPVFVYDPWKY